MKILTPSGFQSFEGIKRWEHNSYIKFTFDNGEELSTSEKHRFIVDGKEKYSNEIKIGDDIGKVVVGIDRVNDKKYFYDPINVDNGSIFCHDESLVSHNTFFGTGDTLIGGETLLSLRAKEPEQILEGGDMLVYETPQKGHNYIFTVDVSKGRGQDYSTFTAIDISDNPFRQVAVYRCNTISPILFPNLIYKYANLYNEAYVVVESNDQGTVVCNGLYHELEYENVHVNSSVKASGIGIEMTRKSKRIGCSSIKDLLENNKLEIVDENTIMEVSTFVSKGQSYEASNGNHDDLMMNLVMFGYFASTQFFSDMTDIDIKQILFEEKMQQIEDDIPPFGFIDDGSDYINEVETVSTTNEWSVWNPHYDEW